jgi:hypothetical protein
VKPPDYWTIPRDWDGPCFILAGGPSVLGQDLSLLDGHRVIAVNSAWRSYPKADVLFFGDEAWWREFGPGAIEGYRGTMVTIANVRHERLLRLRRVKPPACYLSEARDTVAMVKTSVAGAVNLAWHRGADPMICLLGVDLQFGEGNRRHHHGDKYPKPPHPEWKLRHRKELEGVARALAGKGVQAVNCSPVSEIKGWRNMPLEDAVCLRNDHSR